MLSIELLFAFIMSLAFWRCDTEQVIYTDQYNNFIYTKSRLVNKYIHIQYSYSFIFFEDL